MWSLSSRDRFLEHQVTNATPEKRKRVEKCIVCQDSLLTSTNAVDLPCGHTYHHSCIMHWLNDFDDACFYRDRCPMCQRRLHLPRVHPVRRQADILDALDLAISKYPRELDACSLVHQIFMVEVAINLHGILGDTESTAACLTLIRHRSQVNNCAVILSLALAALMIYWDPSCHSLLLTWFFHTAVHMFLTTWYIWDEVDEYTLILEAASFVSLLKTISTVLDSPNLFCYQIVALVMLCCFPFQRCLRVNWFMQAREPIMVHLRRGKLLLANFDEDWTEYIGPH